MLKSLHVTNFAIIDQIDLEFRAGMTVLTGETGAGKSILIDAISLLLGDRASIDCIRSQKDKASIIGEFESDNPNLLALLSRYDIPTSDNHITIRREITMQNKNTIKVNETSVTLQQLKELTKYLADVHSQFDTQRLINPANYLELIDGFKRDILTGYLEKYILALHEYRQKISAYRELLEKKKDLSDKNELYRFQQNELEGFHLATGEEESLKEQALLLANFDKIFERLQTVKSTFEEGGVLNGLYDISSHFEKLGEMSVDFKTFSEKTKDYYYELDDMATEVSKRLSSMNFDPEVLNSLSERLSSLEKLTKKYKKTIPELLEYQENLKLWLDQTENFEEYICTARQEVAQTFEKTIKLANDISLIRRQISDRIEKELKSVFKDLVLPHTQLSIRLDSKTPKDSFDEGAFSETGVDSAEFLISTNLGEPLKPLAKTASGGEMSRIMLAFKTIFIRSQNLSTIIFDEIDSGISGFIAKQIAKKIKEISATCQVISISHIPQVVASGETHLKVWKKAQDGRTSAFVRELGFEERIQEISEMISGDHVTQSSMESAKELLLGD